MKKTFILTFFITFFLLTGCGELKDLNQSTSDMADFDYTFTDVTAQEAVIQMGNGWNLGNTMEAVGGNTGTASETNWGMSVTTLEMMQNLNRCGFNSVRIPVAWYTNGVSSANKKNGTYKIAESYFNRIDEIISYVLSCNMYAVVNIHWDGGWWNYFGSDESLAFNIYDSLWTQIAEHYKDYPQKLIFESANEELGDSLKTESTDTAYKMTNKINQEFVDIVRNSGGNNGKRLLLIAGFNTDITNTCDSRFIMPEDTVQNHLFISVHYYTPWTYCGLETEESWGSPRNSWGSSEDITEMETLFGKMQKFTNAGYPVIIGEYNVGTLNGANRNNSELFIGKVVELCNEYELYCPMLWDCNQWYKRTLGKITDSSVSAIFKN